MDLDSQEIVNPLVGDPRTVDIEPRFQQIISNIAKFFGNVAQLKGQRATHSVGTIASGTIEILPTLSTPAHRIFAPGNRFPVLLRHANIKGFPDDAILDGRGATVRILNGEAGAALSSLDLNDFIVDILMSTGSLFTFNNAETFSRWIAAARDPQKRVEILKEMPEFLPIFHKIIRNPDTYTNLNYYSETTYRFRSSKSTPKEYFMRYRLLDAARSADNIGLIPIEEIRLPLDYLPRRLNDFRPANYLQKDFRDRVSNGGVKYILQIQLQAVSSDEAKNELAKDCTVDWDENECPFHDIGTIDLKEIVPNDIAEQLEFNPYHAPEDLALILAHSIRETASINHMRSIVYQISANMRKYQVPSTELVEWGAEKQPNPEDVYKYSGTPGVDLARFDHTLPLPPRVEPKPRLLANLGLTTIPAKPAGPIPLLGISGVIEIIQQLQTSAVMPANFTRTRPDKFSDEFFVERRLNGFNPGKMKRVENREWQYAIRFDCSKYQVKPAGILPKTIEARFNLDGQSLKVREIEYVLNDMTTVNRPGDADWEWAKRLFRSAEFVLQEAQSHLARTHLNLEQYAMPYYRQIVDNPIKFLLEPHFEGLLNINKLGAMVIFGETGVIPQASPLDEKQVQVVIKDEVSELNYHNWHPKQHTMPDRIAQNKFDPASLAVWEAIELYVADFFNQNGENIQKHWDEIEAMSADLVAHSILLSDRGTLAIANISELQKLCTYVIYHAVFLHSWLNYKQYDDGGDAQYATIGLWDSKHPAYNPLEVTQKQIQQVVLAWTLSHVRYNPVMENGNPVLKNLLWERREAIEPGLPLELLMTSTHI